MRNGRADGDYPGMPKIHDFDIGRGRNRDQTEGEINKIQIDKRAANDSFLIPHSFSRLFLLRESSTDLPLGAEGLPISAPSPESRSRFCVESYAN